MASKERLYELWMLYYTKVSHLQYITLPATVALTPVAVALPWFTVESKIVYNLLASRLKTGNPMILEQMYAVDIVLTGNHVCHFLFQICEREHIRKYALSVKSKGMQKHLNLSCTQNNVFSYVRLHSLTRQNKYLQVSFRFSYSLSMTRVISLCCFTVLLDGRHLFTCRSAATSSLAPL